MRHDIHIGVLFCAKRNTTRYSFVHPGHFIFNRPNRDSPHSQVLE